MKGLQFPCIVAALVVTYPFSQREPSPWPTEKAVSNILGKEQAKLEEDHFSFKDYAPPPAPPSEDHTADATPPTQDLSYLAYYAYSEVPPDRKPADIILESLEGAPIGAPVEEIKRASDALGLDITFMKTVARIESGFDPKQRTGSYIGLFQLSNYEFDKYGSGNITDARDNAIAAAYKFTTEAILFELNTHKKPTLYDRYLIHQQGTQGAEEHVSHPERIAWQSICATDEGRKKGEQWCKRAIWKNTLPTVKEVWKSVDKLTSGAFVDMWQQRLDLFYARYSQPDALLPAVAVTPDIPLPMPRPAIMLASSTTPARKEPDRHALPAVAMAQHNVPTAHASSAKPPSSRTATRETKGKPTAGVASHQPSPGPKPASTTASIPVSANAQKPAARRLATTNNAERR
jgi:hypothetical protein